MTKKKLEELILRETALAAEALENAQLYDDGDSFVQSEVRRPESFMRCPLGSPFTSLQKLRSAHVLDPPHLLQVMFKQAWSFARLLHPEDKHKVIVEGLADTLFGQGER